MGESIQARWKRLTSFLSSGLWYGDLDDMGPGQAFVISQLRVGVLFVQGFSRGRIQLRASAMTFTTLLTLGPVLILVLSVCQAFGLLGGLQSHLESFLLDNLSPGAADQVRGWILRFFEGVRSGAFRSVSVLVLVGGVLGLLGSIEAAFHDIWGVRRGRPLFQRFAIYTTLIVFGPILIGLSLSATASLESAALRSWLADRSPAIKGLLEVGFRLVPPLCTGLAFTLLYTVVPNVRVRLRALLPAGLVAGFLWEVSKHGYRWYLHRASHYGTIYGSLAAIPLFLVWVFLSWLVVLFGAQLAFARDAARDFRLEEEALDASPLERTRGALLLVLAAARAYREGQPPPELITLSHRLRLPLRLVRSVAEDLSEAGIVHLIAQEEDDRGMVPARNPEKITVYDVVSCVVQHGTSTAPPAEGTSRVNLLVDHLLAEIDRSLRAGCGELSLSEILDRQSRLERQDVLPFPERRWQSTDRPGKE